jgi:hypothetical protein
VSHTGGELERRQQHAPAPYRQGQHRSGEFSAVIDWPELGAWARGRGVVVAGVVLIGLSLIWKAIFLGHYTFWQDDFHFTELALDHSFSWSYLTYVGAGHMFPAVYAIVWVWARVALYNWTSASAITIIFLAAGGLAALRLLRTLFGNRPAILVLLVIYLISPLTLPEIRWWSVALETVPLQAVLFLALNSQVWYVRTGRFRHGLAVAAWLLVGLLFFEKALILPLLLVLFTSGFLMGEGNWLRSIGRTLVKFWPSWVLQLVMLAVYAVVLKNALKTSTVQPTVPNTVGGVSTFTWDLLKDTFVPGSIGGPWVWFPQTTSGGAEWAYAAPPKALVYLSLIVAACIIGASIWARRYAWRAWGILAVWFLLADVTPVVLGRINELGPGGAALLALDTHYVSDAVPVLAVCLGLAFLPVDGIPDLRQKRRMAAIEGLSVQPGRMIGAALVGALIIGSVFSVQAFQSDTTSLPVKIFLANAEAAVAEAPAGTVVYDQPVPMTLMIGLFPLQYREDSGVIEPMESTQARSRIYWTTRPDGTIDLMEFGTDGRLHTADIYGPGSVPLTPQQHGCYRAATPADDRLVIPFTSKTFKGNQVLRIAYLASSAVNGQHVTVRYGGVSQRLTLVAGLHDAYLPVRGSVHSVAVSGGPVAGPGLCIGGMRAGIVYPSTTGPTIPAAF